MISAINCLTLLCLIVPICGNSVPAQTKRVPDVSSLRVLVLDQNSAAIVGAQVTIKDSSADKVRIGLTDSSGVALFSPLQEGACQIYAGAAGFAPRNLEDFALRAGTNRVEIRLEVARVSEKVAVEQSTQEKRTDPRGLSFSRILTADQIAQLPEDPDELEAVLKQMAGPGAVIRVNGFRGGKLPPKSQIRQIRFQLTPYSAENHDFEFAGIDITTQPGAQGVWRGSLLFNFRDESLNARNPFARKRAAEQQRRFQLTLDGPLWPKHTGLSLSLDGDSSYDSKAIVTAQPEGPFASTTRTPWRTLDMAARTEHALSKTHTLSAEYQRSFKQKDNLGVGGFDLPERAYSTIETEHILRVADSGVIGKYFFNEFRGQVGWRQNQSHSASSAPTITVLDAFTRGGAGVNNKASSKTLELADNLDFTLGKNSMRTGMQCETGRYNSRDQQNTNGTFIFSSLDAFRQGRPTTYTQHEGNTPVSIRQNQFSWYVEDDLRVHKNLSLSLGVRHEMQNYLPDHNNFAPRVGLIWSPFGNGETTVRAGGGIYYQWFGAEVRQQIVRGDGQFGREMVISNPGYPNPFAGGAAIILPPSRMQGDSKLRMPYFAQASFALEHQLRKRFQLIADYRFQRGVHLLRTRDLNAPFGVLGRPQPMVGNIIQIESTANSTSHELNVGFGPSFFGLDPQHPRRAFWLLNYTLSKTVNDTDDVFALPADNYNLRAERGPAATDVRHRFFGMLDLKLPRGLRLGTFVNLASAATYNITTGFDDNGDTVSNDRPAGFGRNSARGAGQRNVNTRLSWSVAFGKAAPANPGRIITRQISVSGPDGGGGGIEPAPGGSETDKRFRVTVFLQAYNLFNQVNRMNFSGVQASPFFGQATSALPARKLSTGLQLTF